MNRARGERREGGDREKKKKIRGNNQNEITCGTTSRASTSVASVSDVVN